MRNGTIQTFSSLYTPASNGVAETYNRILLQQIQAVLMEAGIIPNFWGEAVL